MADAPRPNAPGTVPPTPGGLVTAYAAHRGVTLEEVAARLHVEPATLAEYDRAGGPVWLRLALAGLAVADGADPAALAWLLGGATAPQPSPRTGAP